MTDTTDSPTDAEAGIRFGSTGILTLLRNALGDIGLNDEWTGNQGAGIGTLYEVRVTRTSGLTLTTGEANLGTWLPITTGRTFALLRSNTLAGTSTAVLSCTVRRTDLSASDSGNITLSATVL